MPSPLPGGHSAQWRGACPDARQEGTAQGRASLGRHRARQPGPAGCSQPFRGVTGAGLGITSRAWGSASPTPAVGTAAPRRAPAAGRAGTTRGSRTPFQGAEEPPKALALPSPNTPGRSAARGAPTPLHQHPPGETPRPRSTPCPPSLHRGAGRAAARLPAINRPRARPPSAGISGSRQQLAAAAPPPPREP